MHSNPAWLNALLDDPQVTDICLQGPYYVGFDRGQGVEPLLLTEGSFWENRAQLFAWAMEKLREIGKSWDARYPFLDGTLAPCHRLHLVFESVSAAGLIVSIRRLGTAGNRNFFEHDPAFQKLRDYFLQGKTVMISGGTGSGKTTLANHLLASLRPYDRVLAIEDTPEFSVLNPGFLSLVSRPPNADGFGELTSRTLLKQTLRMRPDRIVLGECRGSEVLDLLQALNVGHAGSLCTLHANSPRDALRRLELLCQLSGQGKIESQWVRELIANSVHLLVQVRRTGARRTIDSISKIEGLEKDIVILRPIYESLQA